MFFCQPHIGRYSPAKLTRGICLSQLCLCMPPRQEHFPYKDTFCHDSSFTPLDHCLLTLPSAPTTSASSSSSCSPRAIRSTKSDNIDKGHISRDLAELHHNRTSCAFVTFTPPSPGRLTPVLCYSRPPPLGPDLIQSSLQNDFLTEVKLDLLTTAALCR